MIAGEGDHVIARAEYDFDGENDEELSFRAGDILRLAPKGKQPRIRGWLLGSLDGSSEGIVPANYVKVCSQLFLVISVQWVALFLFWRANKGKHYEEMIRISNAKSKLLKRQQNMKFKWKLDYPFTP